MNSLSIKIGGRELTVKAGEPLDISIPLDFGGAQPNAFGVEKATSIVCKSGEIVGDTRRGGSCNFEQITLVPHCNGTHTECVGHITNQRISVSDCLRDAFILSTLISVAPASAAGTSETYAVELDETDQLITRQAIEQHLQNRRLKSVEGLIIRTLPSDDGKLTRNYATETTPFFSTEAMRLIRELNIKHLLVDTPSIDRSADEGKLSNHRIFWNVAQGAFEIDEESLTDHTITELIYVPDEISDGDYLLNLQIAPFAADASPSRPLLFRFGR